MSIAGNRMALCCSYQGIVHRAGATKYAAGSVCSKSKNELRICIPSTFVSRENHNYGLTYNNGQDHDRMNIIREKCGFNTTEPIVAAELAQIRSKWESINLHSIKNNPDWEQKTSGGRGHTRQRCDNRGTSS